VVAARLEAAWARADIRPTASRIAAGTVVAAAPSATREIDSAPFVSLTPIPTPAASGSLAPQLTASPDGRVYLSWLEPTGAAGFRFRIAARQGDAWSLLTDITQGTGLFANWADVPSLFAAANGRIAAHWLEKSATGGEAYGIRVRTSPDRGVSWTDTLTPHDDQSPTEHGFLSFFDAPDGGIGMVWLDGRQTSPGDGGHGHGGGAMSLRATTLGASGALGADVLVDDRVCDCCPTTAARTPRGALVAYRDRSATEVRDISVARFEGGVWKPGGTVHADGWEIGGCPVNGPALATSGDLAAIAWFTAAGDQGRALVAFSGDGGVTIGEPVRVDDGMPLGRVDLELLPDGSAVAVWIESSKGHAEVRARRVFADAQRGPSTVVATVGADRASGHPRIVRSGDELVFVWRTAAPHAIAAAVAAIPPDARR
jgi:hypothetical protein